MEQTKAEVIKLVGMSKEELPVDIGTKNGRGSEFCQNEIELWDISFADL